MTGTPKVMMRLMDRYVQPGFQPDYVHYRCRPHCYALDGFGGLRAALPCSLAFTVAVNFGVMGFVGIPLDAVTSIIASLAIG